MANAILGLRPVSDCWVSSPAHNWTGWDFASGAYPDGAKPFRALWDTGSEATFITPRVVKECHLVPFDTVQVARLWRGNVEQQETYAVTLGLPGGIVATGLSVHTLNFVDDVDVVIGMDLILRLGLSIGQRGGVEPLVTFHLPEK